MQTIVLTKYRMKVLGYIRKGLFLDSLHVSPVRGEGDNQHVFGLFFANSLTRALDHGI